jgi:hypothetical protein
MFACGIAAVLCGCGRQQDKLSPPPVAQQVPIVAANTVQSLQPARLEAPVLPESVATVVGIHKSSLKSPAAGYLVRQIYKDDEIVAAGDVLFLLDPHMAHPGMMAGAGAEEGLIKVRAPAAGMPGHAAFGPGDHLMPGDELTTIADLDNVAAELALPEDLARQFSAYLSQPAVANAQPHPRMELILPGGSVYPRRGIIGNVVTSGNMHTMQVDFPNPDHVLRPGEFVRVRSAVR